MGVVTCKLLSYLARDLTVISARRIEQQQGVAGGGGVHHHELLARFADDPRKGLEHGDFLRAGRTQVFFQQRAALGVKLRAFRFQHMLPVAFGFGVRVDPAHGEIVQRAVQCFGKMSGRVCRREVYRQATMGQLHGHRRGESRFSDAAFAHQHHQAVLIGGDDIDQRREAGCIEGDLPVFTDDFPRTRFP